MKKILLLSLILSLGLLGFSQNNRLTVSKPLRDLAVPKLKASDNAINVQTGVKHSPAKSVRTINEEEIGQTVYDLQSNQCTPYGRFVYYDDGTMGAVWTMGTGTYTDRGTGYNFFNGTSWGPEPTARIENTKTGWPSYCALGPTGEVTIAHVSGTAPLVVCKRATKGTGAWTQYTYAGPSGHQLLWPRMVSGGTDHNTIHIIGLTAPVANGGTAYLGQDGAVCYSRSTDGGVTWDKSNVVLDGTGSSDYVSFGGDAYSFVEPKGDNLAIIYCDNQNDFFVMKSTDAGETWSKTVIWDHPYPHWNGTSATDTFYCPDGSAHGAFDNNGLLHIVFGVNRAMADGSAASWFPFVDGIAYWNENLPTWTGGTQHEQEYCLDPNTLDQQGSLVGWMQDINGNGQLDLVGTATTIFGLYYLSPSSMPQLAIDNNNMLYLMYSGITETFDNGTQQYRHIWGRGSEDGGQTWGNFMDFTGDVLHAYDECVFPVIAAKTDDNVHCIYQADNEPGLSVRGDLDPAGDNFIRHLYPNFGFTPPTNFTVDGTVTYPKNPPVPLNGIQIGLKDNGGTVIQTATTDATGNYSFNEVPEGTYTLAPTTTKPWGGVTAGDVLLYKKHIAGISTLTGISLASGDVNASGSLTAGDVLLIKKRIAGIISSFTVGDWIFDNAPLNVTTNTTADFNGLVYGDANASYTPATKGNTKAVKGTAIGEVLTIENVNSSTLGSITIPVHATAINNLGSFQFSISYDSTKLIYVKDTNWFAGITGVTINPLPNGKHGKASFVWAADAPINISDNTLFEMKFDAIDYGNSTIAWSDDPTPREFSDWDGNILEPTYNNGTIDILSGVNELSNTSIIVSPNPNNGNFTLDLSSVKSQITNVKVINMVGGVVFQEKVAQNASFNQNINLSNLSEGVYTILIQTTNGDMVKKMIIKK